MNYIDFEQQVVEKSFWKGSVYESIDAVMERVNEWIRKNYNNKIVNIETIVLPKSHYKNKGANTEKLNMHGGYVYMIQIVRVWYQ